MSATGSEGFREAMDRAFEALRNAKSEVGVGQALERAEAAG